MTNIRIRFKVVNYIVIHSNFRPLIFFPFEEVLFYEIKFLEVGLSNVKYFVVAA